MYGMVKKGADEIFKLCRSPMKDPEERLALIWEDLENTYGHREREPRTELDKLHRKPAIDCTEKVIQILLKDLGHTQIHVSRSPYEHELSSAEFIEGMIMRLSQSLRTPLRHQCLFRP